MPVHPTPIIASNAEPIDLSEKASPVVTSTPPLLAISTLLDHDHNHHQSLHSLPPARTAENQLGDQFPAGSVTSSTSRDGSAEAAAMAQTVGGLDQPSDVVARSQNQVRQPIASALLNEFLFTKTY